MTRLVLLLPLLLLAACGAQPAPQFLGAERHEVVRGGIRFVVFLREGNAEVIRLGYLGRAARASVPALMVEAAEAASGCKVVGPSDGIYTSPSKPTDSGEQRFALDCPGAGG